MKSRLALVAVMVLATAPLAAQGGGGAPGGGRGMGGRGMNIEAMTALYTLTPEQVTKADAEAFFARIEDILKAAP